MLQIREVPVEGQQVIAVVFAEERLRLVVSAKGLVGNSIVTSGAGKARQAAWKQTVMTATHAARAYQTFNPNWRYAITTGFRFHPASHGNNKLDVENYMKPALDALAAGLFSEPGTDPASVTRYNYDDSGFRYLFIHRLADASVPDDEGAVFVVSVKGELP